MNQKEKRAHITKLKNLIRQELEILEFSKKKTKFRSADFIFTKPLKDCFELDLEPDVRHRDGAVRINPIIGLTYLPLRDKILSENHKNTTSNIGHFYVCMLPGLFDIEFEGGDWYCEYFEPVECIAEKFTRFIIEYAIPSMTRFASLEATMELLEARANGSRDRRFRHIALMNAPLKLKLMRELVQM